MKSKRRHELQTNELADWLGKHLEAIQPYTSWLVGGLIVLVLAGVIISIRSARQSAEATAGWDRFERARTDAFNALSSGNPLPLTDALDRLQSVADEYSGSPVGIFARLAMGDVHLTSGQNQFRSNKTAARDLFKKAAAQYEAVATSADDPQVRNRALFSLAKSYEWQSKYERAKEFYGKVEGPYRSEAQRRLEDLSRSSTLAFYEKLASWKPKPPPEPAGPEAPGRYPDFELDDDDAPTARGDFDYQRYLDATASGVDVVPPAPEPSDDAAAEAPASDDQPTEKLSRRPVDAKDAPADAPSETKPEASPDTAEND